MKMKLLNMILKFLTKEHKDISIFTKTYICEWVKERDITKFKEYFPLLEMTLSSVFVISDLYNNEDGKKNYEFNDDEYLVTIKSLLIHNGIISGIINNNYLYDSTKQLLTSYDDDFKRNPELNPKNNKKYGKFPIDLQEYLASQKELEAFLNGDDI